MLGYKVDPQLARLAGTSRRCYGAHRHVFLSVVPVQVRHRQTRSDLQTGVLELTNNSFGVVD